MSEEARRSDLATDSCKKGCVVSLCCSSVSSSEQEQHNPPPPLERNPVPFIGSRFYNQCKNITQSLLIITGLLMCSNGASKVASHHTASAPFFVTKQNDKINENPIKVDAKSNTCQFNLLNSGIKSKLQFLGFNTS